MTVSSIINTVEYNGNGATVEFPFPYLFYAKAHLAVTVINASGSPSVKVLDTDYTVSGEGLDEGGAVTFTTAPITGETVIIQRIVPLTQLIDYINGGAFPAETHERGLDLLTMIGQQLDEQLERTLTLQVGSEGDFEISGDRASKIIGFDNDGNATLYTPDEAGFASASSVVYLGSTVQQALDNFQFDTLAEMAAITATEGTGARIQQGGRAGPFRATTADISTEVTADPQQGVYVAFASDPTGASGGWVRQYGQALTLQPEVHAGWFGVVANNTDSDQAEGQACIDFATVQGNDIVLPAGPIKMTAWALPQQHGGIKIRGASRTSSFSLGAGTYYGTVLVSDATTQDVISADGGASYINRGVTLEDFNIVATTTGWLVNLVGCPEASTLRNITAVNKDPDGNGVQAKNCWSGMSIENCIIQGSASEGGGSGPLGTANAGLSVTNDIVAGGLRVTGGSIDGWFSDCNLGAGVYQAKLDGVGLQGGNYGIFAQTGVSFTAEMCHFEFNVSAGIYLSSTIGSAIRDCTFYDNGSAGFQSDIYCAASGSEYQYGLVIDHNRSFGLRTNATFINIANAAFGEFLVHNNYVDILPGATGTVGLNIGAGSENVDVQNNQLENCATPYAGGTTYKAFSKMGSAFGHLTFPSTAVPHTGPRTLDDYREGTFAPTYEGSTGAGTSAGYNLQAGKYTKIGNMVTVTIRPSNTTWSVAPTGDLRITGLPFTASSDVFNDQTTFVVAGNLAAPVTGKLVAKMNKGEAFMTIYEEIGGQLTAIPANTANLDMTVSGSYFTDQ